MLSLFPEILYLAPLSALLIRIAAGLAFGYAASKHIIEPALVLRALGVVEGLCALTLIVGLYAQAAALLGIVLFMVYAFQSHLRVLPASTAWILLVLCISLLITGAGPFAIDLPL